MFSVYLAALLFGLTSVAIQWLTGAGEQGADTDASDLDDLPPGGETASLGELSPDGQLSEASAQPLTAQAEPWQLAERKSPSLLAQTFLSLRFYLFSALGFGFVGTATTWLQIASPLTTLVAAGAVGASTGLGAVLALRWLQESSVGSGGNLHHMVGRVGRVLIACRPNSTGKVRLQWQGQTRDYLATTDESAGLKTGQSALIVEVRGQSVHVCAAPYE